MPLQKALRDVSVFAKQSEDFIAKLCTKAINKAVKKGETLIKEGAHVEEAYFIESGRLKRTKMNAKTKEEILIDEVGDNKITGLLHILEPEVHDVSYVTVTALIDTKIWILKKVDLFECLRAEPGAPLKMITWLAHELRQCRTQIRQLKTSSTASEPGMKNLRVLCYDSAAWVREAFGERLVKFHKEQKALKIHMTFSADTLGTETVSNAAGYDAVCLFVNDTADPEILQHMSAMGVEMIAMRCAGFDRVHRGAAEIFGFTVARVPAYSPYAVAEHGVSLLMSLNRKIHRAVPRVKDMNFTLDGLTGFDLHGKTVGVLGTGKIGVCLCEILLGFGVNLLCMDPYPNAQLKTRKGVTYVSVDEIWPACDVIFFMMPLMEATKHMLNSKVIPKLKKGVVIINTSRGGLIETGALLEGLRSGVIAGAGLDVYEHEAGLFFRDCSAAPIQDRQLSELISLNNVILTGHQAFLTKEAVDNIADTTVMNLKLFTEGKRGRDHPNDIFKL